MSLDMIKKIPVYFNWKHPSPMDTFFYFISYIMYIMQFYTLNVFKIFFNSLDRFIYNDSILK